MEKKMIEIKYEVVGGKRTDTISFYAKGITEAIKMFEAFEHDYNGCKCTYAEHSIISIN